MMSRRFVEALGNTEYKVNVCKHALRSRRGSKKLPNFRLWDSNQHSLTRRWISFKGHCELFHSPPPPPPSLQSWGYRKFPQSCISSDHRNRRSHRFRTIHWIQAIQMIHRLQLIQTVDCVGYPPAETFWDSYILMTETFSCNWPPSSGFHSNFSKSYDTLDTIS